MNLINNSLLAYYIRRARRWTPAALFAQGQQGVWYEPKLQYLYQDAAGTIPVTADGDPKYVEQDISGTGTDLSAVSSSARPLYRTDGAIQWNQMDGVDDVMRSQTVIQPPATLGVALRLPAGTGYMYGFGGGYLAGASGYGVGRWNNGRYVCQARIGSNTSNLYGPTSGVVWVVVMTLSEFGELTITDGGGKQSLVTSLGGMTADTGLALGRPAISSVSTEDFLGEFYGAVAVGEVLSDMDVAKLRSYLAALAGVTP